MSKIRLIVGLGNPGREYEATRHNAGFWVVERFGASAGVSFRKEAKYQAMVGRHEPSGAWLLLPQTYMNGSGKAVSFLAGFFKIPPEDILVVHDELDFAPGVARLKQGGGIAGHNGLKDISSRIGSHDYWRLRIGIGHPGDKDVVADYVLHKPSQEDRKAIDAAIERAVEVLPAMLAGDMQAAMLKLHTQEKEPPAPMAEASASAAKPAGKAAVPAAEAPATKADAPAKAQSKAAPQKASKESAKPPEPAQPKSGGFKSLLRSIVPGSGSPREK